MEFEIHSYNRHIVAIEEEKTQIQMLKSLWTSRKRNKILTYVKNLKSQGQWFSTKGDFVFQGTFDKILRHF